MATEAEGRVGAPEGDRRAATPEGAGRAPTPEADHRVTTPLDEATVRSWQVGETVLLDGLVFGCRDATMMRIFERRQPPPVDLRGQVLLHTAPGVRKEGDKYVPISIGTTTSMRMDRFTEELLRDHGVRGIIGKGGLSPRSAQLMRQYGAVYLAITGGAASVQTLQIKDIEAVYWEDLMPECLWQFRVEGLGPLIVAIDTHGNNLHHSIKESARSRAEEILARMDRGS